MHYNLPSNVPLSRLNASLSLPSLFIRFVKIVIALYLYKFRIGPISTHFHTEIRREIKIRRDTKPRGEPSFQYSEGSSVYTGISSICSTRVCVYTAPLLPPDPRNEIDSVTIPPPGLAISNFVTYYILLRVDRSTIGEGLFSAKSANRKCF